MKWGVRKKRGTPQRQTKDYKETVPLRRRDVSTLTNKQLQTVNNRLNLEQNYARMNPKAIKRGTLAVAGVLATAKVGVDVYNTINSPAGKAAIAAGKKAIELKMKR